MSKERDTETRIGLVQLIQHLGNVLGGGPPDHLLAVDGDDDTASVVDGDDLTVVDLGVQRGLDIVMGANSDPMLGEGLLDRTRLDLALLGDSVHGEGHGVSIKCLDHRETASRGKAEGSGNRGGYNFRHSTTSVSGARGPGTGISVSQI